MPHLIDELPLKERINEMLEYISYHEQYLENNTEALEIYEGDLEDKVLSVLSSTLSPEYYRTIAPRCLPINFMPKIIDKMAQVYSVAPKRTSKSEQNFITDYEKFLDIDAEMSLADEYANLFKGYALEPFVSHDGKPSVRSIPFDEFLVMGGDPTDRRRVTVFIKFMGTYLKEEYCPKTRETTARDCQWYIAYTDNQILAFDLDKDTVGHVTEETEGTNPIGIIPFIYGNRSKQRLLPTQDTDLVQMIKMFPVLFTDLGGAVMYQCFTIMYGVDVDTDQIKMSPNAFWDFKSDKTSEKKPEIGTINPEAQVDKVLAFIAHVMGAWAESKSIKVGSIGKMEGDNIASGVSKMVDNMDTFEVRKKNIPFFRKEEKELWYLLALMNNHWLTSEEVDLDLYPISNVNAKALKKDFSIEFEPPRPMENRGEVVDTQIKEINNSLTTTRRAVEKINPELDDGEIDVLMKEIEAEETERLENVLEGEDEITNDEVENVEQEKEEK